MDIFLQYDILTKHIANLLLQSYEKRLGACMAVNIQLFFGRLPETIGRNNSLTHANYGTAICFRFLPPSRAVPCAIVLHCPTQLYEANQKRKTNLPLHENPTTTETYSAPTNVDVKCDNRKVFHHFRFGVALLHHYCDCTSTIIMGAST